MSIIRKVNGKNEILAEKSIIDHSQLSNRDSYGAHSISSIRKLPEKLTALKNKDTQQDERIETLETFKSETQEAIQGINNDIDTIISKSENISLEEDDQNPGMLKFTDFNGDVNLVQGGFLPDGVTIVINDTSKKLEAIAIKDENDVLTVSNIKQKYAEFEADIANIEEDIQDINEIDNTQNDRIFHLESVTSGVGGYLNSYDFGSATPTQDELTQYAMQDIGIDDPSQIFNGTKVINLFDNNTWILTNTPDTQPPVFSWENLGAQKPIAIANNDGLYGLVTGSYEQLEGYIDLNGKITINGLEEALSEIDTSIGDLSDKYVTLNTDQTINGLKTIETDKVDALVLRTTNNSGTHNIKFRFNQLPVISTDSNHLTISSAQNMHLAADNLRFLSNDVMGQDTEETNLGRNDSRFNNLYLKNNLSDSVNEISIAQLTQALTITRL